MREDIEEKPRVKEVFDRNVEYGALNEEDKKVLNEYLVEKGIATQDATAEDLKILHDDIEVPQAAADGLSRVRLNPVRPIAEPAPPHEVFVDVCVSVSGLIGITRHGTGGPGSVPSIGPVAEAMGDGDHRRMNGLGDPHIDLHTGGPQKSHCIKVTGQHFVGSRSGNSVQNVLASQVRLIAKRQLFAACRINHDRTSEPFR